MNEPIICFGQQPCGFFPKRFLAAKVKTARKLQSEIGGKIVFFYHDSDADYRETITIMRDKRTGAETRLNFLQENKIQKKFSPLYAKKIPVGWKEEILKQLPRFVEQPFIEMFQNVQEKNTADFCLEMYRKMALVGGMEIARSGDKKFREQATELEGGYFIDTQYQGETVRAKWDGSKLTLHEGGGKYIELPALGAVEKWQKNPARDQRFRWMQSVIGCTHYIYGEGEKGYLTPADFPEVTFVDRENIDQPEYAFV